MDGDEVTTTRIKKNEARTKEIDKDTAYQGN